MPSSPRTPTQRRKSSAGSIDLFRACPSPTSPGYTSLKPSFSRRSSQYSIRTPTSPRPPSSYGRIVDFSDLHDDAADEAKIDNGGSGLGNLADELAEAYEEENEGDAPLLNVGRSIVDENNPPVPTVDGVSTDQSATVPQSSDLSARSRILLSPSKMPHRSKHRRQDSQCTSSDYGDDSDLDAADIISSSLEARMAAIESLAKRGTTKDNESTVNSLAARVASSLKDLPSQSGIENGTSRLITTHAALTAHLATQTRTLQALAHPILSPLALPPDPEVIEELLPLLATLLVSLPSPTAHCLSSLHSLRALTGDLQSTLTYLADTIYMTRQTTTSATRKLRTATEVVVEMRRETEAREEAIRWIENGGWERRLGERECKRVCGDVIGGFEELCQTWRQRLVAGVGVA